MIIQKKQLNVFKIDALKKFEDDMVVHIKEFFPNHFISMKEQVTRNTVQYAFVKAQKYGFKTQRNVCLYLNTMLVLGSNFDTDPQYPWAIELLHEKEMKNPNVRIDKIADMMLDTFGHILGPGYSNINKMFLNLTNHSEEIYKGIITSELKDVMDILKKLYPKKYDIVGEFNLDKLVWLGNEKATRYGLTTESNKVLFIVFMFLSGAGFDADPQFPWASKILNNEKDQHEKSRMLFHQAIINLNVFLSHYNTQN